MHFDTPPPPHQPKNFNKDIPPRELRAMIEYFDQLISMGVLIKGKSEVAGSVFTVEKPELDEHVEHLLRVISNFKEGGSNSYMMPDPFHLERSDNVLYLLYKGGWSMKVDGSKWFHNLPTCTEEQQYLGAIHPGTVKVYFYAGLAMGASSSPAEARKGDKSFGNTVIEDLGHDYQGFVNHPLNLATNQPYKPELGMCIVYKTRTGVFRPKLKSHVDNFSLHAKEHKKLITFGDAVITKAIILGIVFNPLKIDPPSQSIKYCGMIYNTIHVPVRKLPLTKISRIMAVSEYVLQKASKGNILRLTMNVLIGLLQPVVDGIPNNLANTLLRPLYVDLHNGSDVCDLLPSNPSYYHCQCHLFKTSLIALEILTVLLRRNLGTRAYPKEVCSLNI